MFDFEPFNSVITTHYFSVFFDLHSLQLKNSAFFYAATILDYNYFLCVCECVCECVYVHVCSALLVIEIGADIKVKYQGPVLWKTL